MTHLASLGADWRWDYFEVHRVKLLLRYQENVVYLSHHQPGPRRTTGV